MMMHKNTRINAVIVIRGKNFSRNGEGYSDSYRHKRLYLPSLTHNYHELTKKDRVKTNSL